MIMGRSCVTKISYKLCGNVDITEAVRRPLPDGDVLEIFQQMAMNLVYRGTDTWNPFAGDKGPLSTQEHWKERQRRLPVNLETPASGPCSNPPEDIQASTEDWHDSLTSTTMGSSEAEPGGPSLGKALAEGMKQNHPSDRSDMILIILMAGAIFGMVIAFLHR